MFADAAQAAAQYVVPAHLRLNSENLFNMMGIRFAEGDGTNTNEGGGTTAQAVGEPAPKTGAESTTTPVVENKETKEEPKTEPKKTLDAKTDPDAANKVISDLREEAAGKRQEIKGLKAEKTALENLWSARVEFAKEKGLSVDQMVALTGTTKEEIAANYAAIETQFKLLFPNAVIEDSGNRSIETLGSGTTVQATVVPTKSFAEQAAELKQRSL